jgi:hypothetical protein
MFSYNGFNYRTLYGAPKDGTTSNTNEEQVYAPMPAGFSVSPNSATDTTDIAQYVIAPHYWDVWRLCTESKCYGGLHYFGSPIVKNTGTLWETDGAGNYRIQPTQRDWYRLLIREPCY